MGEIDGQVIVLIIFVVISAVKWLIDKVRGQQVPDENADLEDIYENFREEIRQRQTEVNERREDPRMRPPQEVAPPPLPQSPPPRVQLPQPTPAPVVSESAPVFKEKVTMPSLTAEQRAAAARFEQHGIGSTKKKRRRKSATSSLTIRDLLADPHAARQAIVIQEILGPPKSMQVK